MDALCVTHGEGVADAPGYICCVQCLSGVLPSSIRSRRDCLSQTAGLLDQLFIGPFSVCHLI